MQDDLRLVVYGSQVVYGSWIYYKLIKASLS